MKYYLPAVDIPRSVVVSVVGGFNPDIIDVDDGYVKTISKALTFMAENEFANYVNDPKLIESNTEISHRELMRSLKHLREIAVQNTGLDAKTSTAFLYKLAAELIFQIGESFAEDSIERVVYPALTMILSKYINTATALNVLVCLIDYCCEYYYDSKLTIEKFVKTHYYGITMSDINKFFKKNKLSGQYENVLEMVLGLAHEELKALESMKNVC